MTEEDSGGGALEQRTLDVPRATAPVAPDPTTPFWTYAARVGLIVAILAYGWLLIVTVQVAFEVHFAAHDDPFGELKGFGILLALVALSPGGALVWWFSHSDAVPERLGRGIRRVALLLTALVLAALAAA